MDLKKENDNYVLRLDSNSINIYINDKKFVDLYKNNSKELNTFIFEIATKTYIDNIKQAVDFLKKIQNFFDSNFSMMSNRQKMFEVLLENRIFIAPNDILDTVNNSYKFKYEMEKFIVENMYNSIKIIYSEYKSFFKRQKISDTFDLNSSDDVNKLFAFMKKIIIYNYNEKELEYLFSSLTSRLSSITKNKDKNEIMNYEREYMKKMVIGWGKLIENYDKKNVLKNKS